MKYVTAFALMSLVGCSSVQKENDINKKNLSNAVLEDETVGADVPSWTIFEGIKDGRLLNVGYAEMSVNRPEHFVKKTALMDGEIKLISDAPSDFRVLSQNALTGAGVDSSEFFQIQTKLQEVLGTTGFKGHESTCRKIVRYTESGSSIMRGCWYQVSINISDLKRAYQYTLEKKYGIGKATKFENIMSQELEKINDTNRFTPPVNETAAVPKGGDLNSGNKVGLKR